MRRESSKGRRAVLRLRDLGHSKAAVLNSLGSAALPPAERYRSNAACRQDVASAKKALQRHSPPCEQRPPWRNGRRACSWAVGKVW